MRISNQTAVDIGFYAMLLAQESPFGFVLQWSEAAQGFSEIPLEELTEEQAQVLVADMKEQRIRFFRTEGARHGNESN